ncbi:MAG: N-acetylmuramoyl-L-alanine amidase [Bacteroidales bacterium]|nr:N-acetylmuramoyl-L-alanine amidase [Bacteroidales bacterium]
MRGLLITIALALMCPNFLFAQKKETYRVRTVVIDPGHGGAKPGAHGKKSQEKDITLAVAKKFGKLIADNYPDVKIIYTRTRDIDISLAERANIANRNKADLFISIHANSHPTATPTGVETFVMGLSESKANLEVAKKENADILLESDYKTNSDYQGFDPNAPETYVMLAMFQNAFIDKSLNLAQNIQDQYKKNIKTINRGVKQAELYVLYKTSMPSVLTEVGFISNPKEEDFMLSDEGQAQIALSLFNAFMIYKATEEGSARLKNPRIDIPGITPPPPDIAQKPSSLEPNITETTEQVGDFGVVDSIALPIAQTTDTQDINAASKPLPSLTLAPQTQQPTQKSQPTPATSAAIDLSNERINTAEAGKMYYTIQFLISPQKLSVGNKVLDGLEDFDCEQKGNNYCYTLGHFATFDEASKVCADIRKSTRFKDAWVNTIKPNVDRKIQQTQTTPETKPKVIQSQTATPKGVVFRIQFCSANYIMQKGDPNLYGISEFYYAQSGKVYAYTTGNYSNLRDAEKECARIQKTTPFKDAFVIALRDGQRISLQSAGLAK